MMRVGLVSCVKSKRSEPMPARDLYTSSLFRGARRAVENACDRWFILSARHGLLDPHTVITPYDETLSQASKRDRRSWSRRVLGQLEREFGVLADVEFEVHAGKDYYGYGLVDGLRAAGAKVDIPAEGLRIGQRLRYYTRVEPANANGGGAESAPRSARAGRATVGLPAGKYRPLYEHLTNYTGDSWHADFDEIEDVLRESLPASARRHRAWWSNEPTGSHSHARAWLAAGFETAEVRLEAERLTFRQVQR